MPTVPTPITKARTDVAAFAGAASSGPVGRAVAIQDPQTVRATYGAGTLADAVADFYRHGGRDALVIRADLAAIAPAATLAALPHDRRIGLLILPPNTPTSDTSTDLVTAAVAWCEQNGALLVLDPPSWWASASQAARTADTLPASPHVAVYAPRLVRAGQVVPPAGAVAGLIAATDRARGVWVAPAGTGARLQVDGLAFPMGPREVDMLNPVGINAVRPLASSWVVWGARTRAPSGEFRYLPVARFVAFVEASLQHGLRWTASTGNEPSLWTTVRGQVQGFLHAQWRAGALAGATPAQAYLVRCGLGETMTPLDVAAGRLIVQVGLAVLRPAEYVLVRIHAPVLPP